METGLAGLSQYQAVAAMCVRADFKLDKALVASNHEIMARDDNMNRTGMTWQCPWDGLRRYCSADTASRAVLLVSACFVGVFAYTTSARR